MVFHAYFVVFNYLCRRSTYCVHSCYGWIDDIVEFCDEIDSFGFIEVKNELDQIKNFIRIPLVVIDIFVASFLSSPLFSQF